MGCSRGDIPGYLGDRHCWLGHPGLGTLDNEDRLQVRSPTPSLGIRAGLRDSVVSLAVALVHLG